MRVYLSKYQMGFALNEKEASVYVALKIMYDRMFDKDRKVITYANVQSIYYELSGSFEVPKKTVTLIKQGLQGLIDANVVNVIDTDDKGVSAGRKPPFRAGRKSPILAGRKSPIVIYNLRRFFTLRA